MATSNHPSFATWTTLFLLLTTLATAAADVSPTRLCRRATDPNACEAIIANHLVAAGKTSTKTTNVSSPVLLRQFLTAYARRMTAATSRFSMVTGGGSGHPREKMALADCSELINLSIDQVKDAIKALAKARIQSSRRRRVRAAEAHTYLSAVLTNHVTCSEGLTGSEKSPANRVLEDLISRARVALAILAEIRGQNDDEELKQFKRSRCTHRRRQRRPRVARKCPKWVRSRDRDLLRRKGKEIKADFVVSKDDDADFSTLKKAVDAVEEGREKRVVIYVKEGVYNEYVEVGPFKKNLMIVGDSANETIFTGSHNYVDNYTTFNSFTLASKAANFILQDLSVWNTAGAKKHQAVALRIGGDKSIINRCQIVGYQDTLYAHSQRQFYRDCTIKGTVDFIFGNAAAVFQNCNIVARKPMSSQQNMVTAQGRVDPNQNTGISLQSCGIVPGQDLKPASDEIQTFLGRPWKKYSRTMVMESYIAGHIDPAGWHPWSGNDYLDTLWFGEYDNRGPGSKTSDRVEWKGYHKVEKSSVAADFTVKKLLETEGDRWVADSGVDCTEGLVNN